MTRVLTGVLLLAVAGAVAAGQSQNATTPEQTAGMSQSANPDLARPDLMRLIARYELAVRDAEAAHADHARMANLYADLATLYEEAGMPLKAEDAMERALVFLKDGPQQSLAEEFEQLAVLHVTMGDMRAAQKSATHALQIRQAIGDPVGLALSWNNLAGIDNDERKYKDAADYAKNAFDVLADNPAVSPVVRMAVRQELGFALTGDRECNRGIPILQDAVGIATSAFGPESFRAGYSEYVLGFGYWHCGDRENAALWMERGTTHMKADYGWNRAMYVNAMREYARFLRESGQRDAAVSAEAVVHQAEAVVDARTLAAGPSEGFRSAASK